MATKVTIDGKEYCVETLLHEVKRLKRELTIQAEDNRQFKIGLLTELQLEFKDNIQNGVIKIESGNEQLFGIIQQKINELNSKCEGCKYHMNKPCEVCKSCINGNRYQRKSIH